MKSNLMRVVSFVAVFCVFMSANLAGATMAHWNFEDGTVGAAFSDMAEGGSVDVVNDYVMYGYNQTYGPSFSSETPTGTGLSAFCNGGQDGYTTNPALNTWSPVTWTIEISARLTDLGGWRTLIGRDGSSSGQPESDFYLQKDSVNGAFRLHIATVGGTRHILDSDFAVEAGQWYHLAITCDGATITMYCDKLDGSGYQVVGTLDISGQSPAENALAQNGSNWTFGRGWYDGNFVDHVAGNLDNVRFSDSVLTANEFLGYQPVAIIESEGKTVLFASDTGYTDSYEIALKEAPSDDVVITVTPPAGLEVGNGSGGTVALLFTQGSWSQPRVVQVGIVNPDAALGDVERVQHSVQSDAPEYANVAVRDVQVHIQEDGCGIWGFLPTDYNFDCQVNMMDFVTAASLWLCTDEPIDLRPLIQDWLLDTFTYDEGVYARSIQEPENPFFVNTANVVNRIDEYVYGHFLEHIYHSVNGGLWGDLVWNRSFEMIGGGAGVWSIEGDELVQSSLATDIHTEFGDTAWTDYELTLEVRKEGGSEGFLILFRAPDDDNFYWLNLGGWGNSQHGIEKEVNGSRSVITSYVSGSINTGQWYDIRIRCEGGRFQVWLDGTRIFDFTDTNGAFLNGRVGLGTWATQARFRNIQVIDLDGSTVLYDDVPDIPGSPFNADYWTLFGDGEATLVTDALNDNYSARIISDGSPTGLRQDNFAFTPQEYHGSLWMKGTLLSGVTVELLEGATVLGQAALAAPGPEWQEYTFAITPNAATDDGSLRLTLAGAGTVYIDQVSMMGQDAIDTGGYRPDLLEAVEELQPPIIRWPGGCFASAYFWKDGIGDQHERNKYPINLWDDQDTNSYGTDEFLQMCEALGAEPLIVVNIGLLDGTCGVAIPYKLTDAQYLQDVMDWMEYCNGAVDTTWGALRAENGHPEPYNVKYWEIDNEVWSTQWGGGIDNYIAKVQEYAPAMRAKADELGVPIELIACGSGSYDQSWNQTLIDNCGDLFDYISTHHYENPDNFKQGPRQYESFIEQLGDIIAASSNPDMKIYMSEWNAQSTDWRTGLYAGGLLNAFERTGDVFEIGGPALFLRHTSASGWDNAFINFDHRGWFPAPNYVVMKLWREHYAPQRVEVTGGDSNLNVVSALSEDERTLYIRVVNPDPADKSVAFEIDNSFIPETAYMQYVAPGDLYVRNTLADSNAVYVQTKIVGLDNQMLRFIMPGYSAGVVTVKTSHPHRSKYIYSSFRGNGEDGLHLAWSEDGLTFTALKGDASFLAPAVGSNLMRDPSICQGPDGMFHMVWTTGWWDDGIGLAHSPDLINWSEQTYLPVMADEPDAKNCWAPEIFYDEVTGKFLIFWATTIEGAFPETYNPDDDNNHRIYYVATEDFENYTDTALFYEPGFNVIDSFIAQVDDRYVMVLKDETKVPTAQKNLRLAFSDQAAGPYGPASEPVSPPGLWVEGPSMVRVGQEWVVYYDAYTAGQMGAVASEDLENWTDITGQITFPPGTRHGTVFRVTEDILDGLLAE